MVGGLGSVVGLAVVAYALLGSDTGGSRADDVRAVLIGLGIVALSLAVAAGIAHRDRWAHYVFVVVGAFGALAAVWWAVSQLSA